MNSFYPISYNPRDSQDVLVALREFLGNHREAASYGPETLADLLFEFRYTRQRPHDFEVEVALETLRDGEGELLS